MTTPSIPEALLRHLEERFQSPVIKPGKDYDELENVYQAGKHYVVQYLRNLYDRQTEGT